MLAAISLALAMPAGAADIDFIGTGGAPQWTSSSSWQGGVVPGKDDRAVMTSTTTSRVTIASGPGLELGSVWIPDGSVFNNFLNESMQSVKLYGTDGVGALNESTNISNFFRQTILENDITLRAANVDGGGFRLVVFSLVGPPEGVDIGAHTLTLDTVYQKNRIEFTGKAPIVGSGNVVKTGAGLFSTSVANTYTGRTLIEGGTFALTYAGAVSTSSEINVQTNGTFDISGMTVPAAAIRTLSGDGHVVLGANTLNLTNASTAFSGVIGGDGGVTISGGTQVLSGANTYTGGTTIATGAALQLGGGGTSGNIAGDVVDDGTLAFNRADEVNFGGVISGTGTINQAGPGRTTLTADSSAFSGLTQVQAGILSVNGMLGGTMDVLSGGRLQGNGTVGVTTVQSGGTIAPGNSIGTLHVAGNYTQAAGAVYQAEVDPASSASDQIDATGTATLAPGAILDVVKLQPGAYQAGTRYTVLSAAGGRTGTYDLSGDTGSAFLSLIDTYDADHAYLEVKQIATLPDAADTGNQKETAGGVSSLPSTDPVLGAALMLPSYAAARDALDRLSGEIYASSAGRMLDDSRFVRETALDRARAAFDCDAGALTEHPDDSSGISRCTPNAGRATVWARSFGSWGGFDGDGNATELDRDIGGLFVGADVPVAGNWRVGGLFGFSHSHFSADARNSSASSDDYHVAAYGATQRGALALRLGTAYAWHDIDGSRSIVFPGIADTEKADYRARTAQVFGELGYRLKPRSGVALEPFAGLAYVNLDSDGFQEHGGSSALRVSGANADVTYTTLGVHAATRFHSDAGAQATAHGTLGWRHAFGNRVPKTTLAFDGGSSFTIAGVPIARDALVLEAGVDMALAKNTTLGVSYSGQIADDVQDHGVSVNLTWRF